MPSKNLRNFQTHYVVCTGYEVYFLYQCRRLLQRYQSWLEIKTAGLESRPRGCSSEVGSGFLAGLELRPGGFLDFTLAAPFYPSNEHRTREDQGSSKWGYSGDKTRLKPTQTRIWQNTQSHSRLRNCSTYYAMRRKDVYTPTIAVVLLLEYLFRTSMY